VQYWQIRISEIRLIYIIINIIICIIIYIIIFSSYWPLPKPPLRRGRLSPGVGGALKRQRNRLIIHTHKKGRGRFIVIYF
jgi:hypothetical protein